jgi:hypothetical protein
MPTRVILSAAKDLLREWFELLGEDPLAALRAGPSVAPLSPDDIALSKFRIVSTEQ